MKERACHGLLMIQKGYLVMNYDYALDKKIGKLSLMQVGETHEKISKVPSLLTKVIEMLNFSLF